MKGLGIAKQLALPAAMIVVIVVVCRLLLSGFSSFYEKDVLINNKQTAEFISSSVSSFLNNIYDIGEEMLLNDDVGSMDTQRQTAFFKDAAVRFPEVELFYAQDENGDQTGRSSGTRSSRRTRWWFLQMEETQKSFISKTYYSVSTKAPCTSIFLTIKKPNGDFGGVFGIDVKLKSLQELINKYSNFNAGNYTFLIDGEGSVVAHPVDSYLTELYNFKRKTRTVTQKDANGKTLTDANGTVLETEEFISIAEDFETLLYKVMDGESGCSEVSIDGKKVLAGYAPVKLKGSSDSWSVITVQTIEYSHREFGSLVKKMIPLIIFIILMCGCFCVFNYRKIKNEEVLSEKNKALGVSIAETAQEVSVSAKETAAVSQNQNAAVKEIVATMEDNTNLSENIASKISHVADMASHTASNVESGNKTLEVNVQKLQEIFDANDSTINGIKELSEQVKSIWEIVTFINGVADQAKIIAFNAELEASSAGEAGKNFHIVATEVRRLADGIISSINDIKESITEIQKSTNILIVSGNTSTEKILEEKACIEELGRNFDAIRSASDVTVSSSKEISSIIQQQTSASEQILLTLKQISGGVDNFVQAAENVSLSVDRLMTMASTLKKKSPKKASKEDNSQES